MQGRTPESLVEGWLETSWLLGIVAADHQRARKRTRGLPLVRGDDQLRALTGRHVGAQHTPCGLAALGFGARFLSWNPLSL